MWTTFLVGGLTAMNILFILHTLGPGHPIKGLQKKIVRKIASIQSQPIPKPIFKTPVLELNCSMKKPPEKVHTMAPTTRLKLLGCPNTATVDNLTNASQGDLFPLQKGLVTSDFLPLNEGRNEILVKYGEKSLKVVIFRDTPRDHETDDPRRPSS